MQKEKIVNKEAKHWSKELLGTDKYRLWQVKQIIKRLNGNSFVDIGCGDGDLIKTISDLSYLKKIKGTDLSKIRLQNTRKKIKNKNGIELIKTDIYNTPFKNQEFDIVACLEVIEHVKNIKKALRELQRIAKKYVVISVPYKEEIIQEICVHCGKQTPRAGHLHSLDENFFKKNIGNGFKIIYKKMVLSRILTPLLLTTKGNFFFPIINLIDNLLILILEKSISFLGKPRWFVIVIKRVEK